MRPAIKTDAALRRDQSRFEIAAMVSGGAVFVGLLVEVWLAVVFRPEREPFTQTWGPVIADALIALGVFFEILFGYWALRQGSELQQRAEKALAEATDRASQAAERAAAAELETERLRKELAWRRLSPEHVAKMSEVLSRTDLPKFGLRIVLPTSDPEALRFARDIAEVFRANGWPVQFLETTAEILPGMMIPLYSPPSRDACGITRMAVSNAGIEYVGGIPPQNTGGMFASSGDDLSDVFADMFVGARLPPKLD